jgi:Tol biopolymer transport system component
MTSVRDPQRWEAIRAAFDELVELDAGPRASRLADLGATDAALCAAVESLLGADAEASTRLAPLDDGLLLDADPPPDPLDLVGRMIGHLEVQQPVGAGGMGIVYRGQDTRLHRPVALKFLLPRYSLDSAAKARFLREARAAAALDHPHLCTIYDVRESEDGRLFLAMALYPGETLKARLARDGPLPLAEALSITKQIARGLACAHTAGIVHRDLKPGNVMLLPDGTVKILDFGLAKAMDETTGETDARFGTVAYMAPEQIRAETTDARVDLWALGVVLFEMLTGRKPFEGEHEVAIAHAIVHDDPLSPSTLCDGLPLAVDEVVLGLLQRHPDARYRAVEELLPALAAVGTADAASAPGVWKRRVRIAGHRWTTRRWIAILGAGLMVGGIGGTAIGRWLRPGSPKQVSRYSIALADAEALAVARNQYFRVAISRDGEHLVYVGVSPDGSDQLWLRRRDQLHAKPLAGTVGAVNPFFSPDGSRVGFVTTGVPRALKVISLQGGPPTTVTDSLVDAGGAAWGDDGYIYFDSQGPGIARVRETGGAPELVTKEDGASGEAWHYQPEPVPGGRGVLFVIRRGSIEEADIAVADVASGVHRVLLRGITPRYATSGHLVYATVSGTLMAVPFDPDQLELAGPAVVLAEGLRVQGPGQVDLAVSTSGTLAYAAGGSAAGQDELVWVTRDGSATPIDAAWHADFGSLALSPDGAALAVSVAEAGNYEVWIKQLDRGVASRIEDGGAQPTWTPDGQAVAFVASGGTQGNMDLDLYLRRSDGSAPRRLIREVPGQVWEAQYSRDGKWLVYRAGSDLFAVRTDGDTSRIPLVVTPFAEYTPSLSPDGRWLAYSSDESGTREVYVRPFPHTGTARWRVSIAGGTEPLWSRSGRELFYKNGRRELVAVAVPRGETFTVGEQRVLFSTAVYDDDDALFRTYDVSPDGTRFVMIRPPRRSSDELIVVENFFEELRSRVNRAPRAHASR